MSRLNLNTEKQFNEEKFVIKFRLSIGFIELQIQFRCESDLLYNLLKLNLKTVNLESFTWRMLQWELKIDKNFSLFVGEMKSIS